MRKILRIGLSVLFFLMGLSALHGGWGLISNGMGMPISYLKNTPFTSYFEPGLILLVVVGGTQLAASVWLLKGGKWALRMAGVAGFGLIIWTFTEVYMMSAHVVLQIISFAYGTLELVLTFLLHEQESK